MYFSPKAPGRCVVFVATHLEIVLGQTGKIINVYALSVRESGPRKIGVHIETEPKNFKPRPSYK
jgi:hypothetical protein